MVKRTKRARKVAEKPRPAVPRGDDGAPLDVSAHNDCPVRGLAFHVRCGNGNRHPVVLAANGQLCLVKHRARDERAAEQVAVALRPTAPSCTQALAMWKSRDANPPNLDLLTEAAAEWRRRALFRHWFARMKLVARWRKVLGTADGPHDPTRLAGPGMTGEAVYALIDATLRERYGLAAVSSLQADAYLAERYRTAPNYDYYSGYAAQCKYVCRVAEVPATPPPLGTPEPPTAVSVTLRVTPGAHPSLTYGDAGRLAGYTCLDCLAANVAADWLQTRRLRHAVSRHGVADAADAVRLSRVVDGLPALAEPGGRPVTARTKVLRLTQQVSQSGKNVRSYGPDAATSSSRSVHHRRDGLPVRRRSVTFEYAAVNGGTDRYVLREVERLLEQLASRRRLPREATS